jgi:hypothetical protein
VNLAVVGAAERDGELVADLAAQRPRLAEAQVMGVGGAATADEAWLLGDELDVGFVADAARLRKAQAAFVDGIGTGRDVGVSNWCIGRSRGRNRLSRRRLVPGWGRALGCRRALSRRRASGFQGRQSAAERILDLPSIASG